MNKQKYEDYKYVMFDTAFVYVGAKYNYQEIMENEDVPFKIRTIVERYIVPDKGLKTTLESDLYYMTEKDFTYRTLLQLKAKVKISRLVVKKGFLGMGRPERRYETVIVPLAELAKLSKEEKEQKGIFIQELVINKLSLMSFVV